MQNYKMMVIRANSMKVKRESNRGNYWNKKMLFKRVIHLLNHYSQLLRQKRPLSKPLIKRGNMYGP